MLIYKITNNINGKIYVGQTTKTLQERISMYRREQRWSANRPISRAMKKYGFENFSFEIICDKIENQEQLDLLERYYIQILKSTIDKNGYNVALGGNSAGKHSEETKRKISEAQLGVLNHMYGKMGALNPTSKRLIDLTTGVIYGAASDAARELGLNLSHVCAVCRGVRGSTGERVFRYINEDDSVYIPTNRAEIKTFKARDAVLPQYQKYI